VDFALVLSEDMVFEERTKCLTIYDPELVFFPSQTEDRLFPRSLHKIFLRDISEPSKSVGHFVESYYLDFLINACYFYMADLLYHDLLNYFAATTERTINVFVFFQSPKSDVEKQFLIDLGNKKFADFLDEKLSES
jgi:hypothetical protein